MNDLRAHFRPEFLNRLDETILFKPLTKNNIGSIIDLLVADINKRLADKELVVALSDSAKQFIVDNGYDPVYGARPLKRYLQKNVETLAARLILSDGVHTEIRSGSTWSTESSTRLRREEQKNNQKTGFRAGASKGSPESG